ncbi:MAG TPA: tetratricopeptide repeat protein [Candidatus Thermoplasmatota archaeon]|nr:tetratricopeptide repeat protein [Candidatus Thermoplasmatota archaeon]
MKPTLVVTLGLLFAVVAVAPMTAGELSSSGAQGTNLLVESTAAQVFLPQATDQPGSLSIQGSAWEVSVIADEVRSTLGNPLQPGQYVLVDHQPADASFILPSGGQMTRDAVTEVDAVLLVKPLSNAFKVSVTQDGPYSLSALESKTLEASHAWPATVPRHPRYYEHVVMDTLELDLKGKIDVHIQGDFQIYAWGVDLAFSEGGAIRHIGTGHTISSEHAAGQETARHERFAHAIITVHGGSLTYASSVPLALYANAFQASSFGLVEFQDAQGTVPGRDGDYLVAGNAEIEGGAYEWSRSEGGVGVRFLDSGRVVKGDSVSFQPAPLVQRSWFLPVAASVLLGVFLAAAYLAPAGYGWVMMDRPSDLRGLRAAGFRRWASRADVRGHRRRAAFWASRAHRIRPHDWDVVLDRAIYLSQLGRFAKALRLHEAAHAGFRLGDDRDQLGHNAYQAAKSAVQLGQPQEAIDWLRVAAESEPALASDMAQDPVFSTLRSHPDYLSLLGPSGAW